jgi:hypothetical protein
MGDEQRISHLNSLLNAAVSQKNRSETVHKEAYKRLMQSIEQAITEEQSLAKLSREKTLEEEHVERAREDFKKQLAKQHRKVLKKQMKEKQTLKTLEKEKELQPHISLEFEGYPHHPEEPVTEVLRKKKAQQEEFKKGLLSQIEEKQQLQQRQSLHADMIDRFRVETAKVSLEQEKLKSKEKHQAQLKSLTDAWKQDLEAKELQQHVKQLTKLLDKSSSSHAYQDSFSEPAVDELKTGGENVQEDDEEAKDEPQKLEMTKELMDFLKLRSASLSASKAHSVVSRSTNRSHRSSSIKSSVSRQEAYQKLDQLEQQEEAIRKQKEELLKSIAASSSRSSSRSTVTVASMMSRQSDNQTRRTAEIARQMFKPTEVAKAPPLPPKTEVTDLLKSLFS